MKAFIAVVMLLITILTILLFVLYLDQTNTKNILQTDKTSLLENVDNLQRQIKQYELAPVECIRGKILLLDKEDGGLFDIGETQFCGKDLFWDKRVGPDLETWIESEVQDRLKLREEGK